MNASTCVSAGHLTEAGHRSGMLIGANDREVDPLSPPSQGLTTADDPRAFRVVGEARGLTLLEATIDYVPNPSFDDPEQHDEILGGMPGSLVDDAPARAKPPRRSSLFWSNLGDASVMNREQERHVFRKMNFLKHQAARLRATIDPEGFDPADLDRVEALCEEANAVKAQIVRANLRLVISIAKTYMRPDQDFFELISNGNLSLVQAVDRFDYGRGFRFSTYATWAILKNFSRDRLEERRRRARFVTGLETTFELAPDHRSSESQRESDSSRYREDLSGMLRSLDDRERSIIASRFGLDGARERTLTDLGKEMGISKERVRQIETRALGKLRKLAKTIRQEVELS